jgi:periplasmic protein TonB
MSYQALLFCPDEKTARTVTQILGELEFTVEPCLEPFAAVKKLMSQHFDAIVVDCDNEQNATLLFKSARNSTSNQASLAVAVVEGQAGVAKAFRIGANLVLTKPINIDQSKGTLRVARGLLRKGDPAKASTAPAPGASVPAKPATAKATPPAKPAQVAPAAAASVVAPAAVSIPRPASAPVAAPPLARPAMAPAPAIAATASSAPVPMVPGKPQPEVTARESISLPATAPVLAPNAAPTKFPAQFSKTAATSAPIQVTPAGPAPELSNPLPSASATPFSGGAASAPAPAREVPAFQPEISPANAAGEVAAVLDKPAEKAPNESADFVGAAPTFTFGGANVPESSAGRNKVLLVLAAVLVVAAALYAGWTYFEGRTSQPVSAPAKTMPSPVATPQPVKPAGGATSPTTAAPTTSTPLSTSSNQPAAKSQANATGPSSAGDTVDNNSASINSTDPAKPAGAPPASKIAGSTKSSAPLVVKAGSTAAAHAKPAVADTAAPSVPEIVMPGSSAPPPNLLAGASNGPAPVLQTMNISQGVSQGLLIKKVQPQYPRNALSMHVEGAVQLMATVSATGNITAVKILSGDALLTKAASDAVKQWKYKPYRLNGEPVEIQTQITVNFALPH